jgi:hypothetical protein
MSKTRIVQVLLLNLVGPSFAQVAKEVKVANLAKEGTSADDSKAFPETPDDTAKDSNNLEVSQRSELLELTSCPPSGGKEITKRMPVGSAVVGEGDAQPIGIVQPAGSLESQ